jgi:competence ComEA-like helix-hairpin-helix protein
MQTTAEFEHKKHGKESGKMTQHSKSSSKINLNTASLEELSNMSMVGAQRAQSIIKYRDEHGPFRNWEDLDNIPGFSKGMVHDLKKEGVTIE